MLDLAPYCERLRAAEPLKARGKVREVVGLTIQASGPSMRIGDLCHILSAPGEAPVPVEVVGFKNERILLMPLGDMGGIAPGDAVLPTHKPLCVRAGDALMGRVVDSTGRPIDGGPPLRGTVKVPLKAVPPPPMTRPRISEPLATGIRAIDGCITCGKGQRIGIMSGSGVGKSKLIGMVARNTSAEINVIGLIGERGREVREFIENDLGEEGLSRSVVVVATSDRPALERLNAAYAATAIAEWFREQGRDVLLMMDSLTRFAMAQREVGLAVGEPPTTKGYPPSMYAVLPKLLERSGASEQGSITGFYNVLVEGDDFQDPVADAVRSILDGHVALSRDLATRGHYPAVDVLESVSRLMIEVTPQSHQELAIQIRQILATYRDAEDLVNIGAYVSGSNPEIDRALRLIPAVRQFLRQGLSECSDFDEIQARMAVALRE